MSTKDDLLPEVPSLAEFTGAVVQSSGAEWIVHHSGENCGPLSTDEVLKQLESGALSWVDYAWAAGRPRSWAVLCDIPCFRMRIPPPPELALIAPVPPPPPAAALTPVIPEIPSLATLPELLTSGGWFIQCETSEYGPFSDEELVMVVRSGKFRTAILNLWREGLPDWTPMEKVPEFTALLKRIPPPMRTPVMKKSKTAASGIRATPVRPERPRRKRILATVTYYPGNDSRQGTHMTGIAQNISLTGILIRSGQLPGYPGAAVMLEIHPLSGPGTICVQATVARIVEKADQPGVVEGFAARFCSLSDATLAALREFVGKLG